MPPELAPFLEIGKFGLLGAIVIILWFKLGERDKQLQVSWNDRINDSKLLQSAIDGVQHAINAMNLQSENRTRASDAVAASLQSVTQSLQELSREQSALRQRVERLLEVKPQ